MAKPFQAVLLASKGDVKQANIPHADPEKLTFQEVHSYMRKKEEPNVQLTHTSKGKTVNFFGYSTGKGLENAHILPPPHHLEHFIGDILVIMGDSWEKPSNMKVKDWESFISVNTEEVPKKKNVKIEDTVEDIDVAEEEEIEDIDDEDDDAEDAEDVEDIEDADDADADAEDTEVGVADGLEDDEQEVPKKKVVKKKIKLTTAFAKQQALLENDEFEEITPDTHVPNEKTLALIKSFFEKEGLSKENQEKLETVIFLSAYNETKRRHVISHWDNPLFKQIYKTVCMRIITNVSPNSYIKNKNLFQKIVSGEFDVNLLADFNSYDLYPEHWKELEDRRLMREQAHMEGNKGMATDQFKCNRCKKRECTSYEMQTRSSDEPMTLFITCMNCGKRWRQ